jgi:hypothetical protein
MTSMHVGLIRLAVMSLLVLAVVAQVGTAGPQATLVEEVRRSTARFNEVAVAEKAGYAPFLGCVSGPQEGAMGLHYVNGDLVGDGLLDAQRPEALMYEVKDGRLKFVGVEFIVLAEAWDAAHKKTPPTLMGQAFHFTPSPNRYGIPAFYALHVWAWKPNPNGMFVDWNPKVSCEGFTAAHSAQH